MSLLVYVDGDYGEWSTFESLRKALSDASRPTHYLAIPPSLFATVIERLKTAGLNKDALVTVVKPFGRDFASEQELNRVVRSAFEEDAIFRIGHFLRKEEIMILFYFRFANSFLEPIWHRIHISSVQITMAEQFGVQGRGAFYETAGCLRDIVQNHLLQVVVVLAMEPSAFLGEVAVQTAKSNVFKAMRPLVASDVVRDQFTYYKDKANVAKDSDVETFCALRLFIDSWHRADVPWCVRSGKCLAEPGLEVLVELKPPPNGCSVIRHPKTVGPTTCVFESHLTLRSHLPPESNMPEKSSLATNVNSLY